MNPKFSGNISVFKILYNKYKLFLVPLGIILVCMFIIILYVIPQFESFFANRDQVVQSQEVVSTLSQNVNILSAIDKSTLQNYTKITQDALPTTKNFSSILSAIKNAAAFANVVLGDYAIDVGSLSVSPQVSSSPVAVSINISIKGGIADLTRFTDALKTQFPLSDVTNVSINNNSQTSFSLLFYYLPYASEKIDNTIPVVSLSKEEVAEIQKLSAIESGNANLNPPSAPTEVPSPSPTILVIPTRQEIQIGTNSATTPTPIQSGPSSTPSATPTP